MTADIESQLQEQVREAAAERRPLAIAGGGSKAFYGRPVEGAPLAVAGHRGVLKYEPSELVITARCGTPLSEIHALLDEHEQMLAFEPPALGAAATLGGSIASGLAGPRRPWGGAVRDHVLGVRCLNGRGEVLHFGGEVVKNVAGFDAARLMAGSLGTLAVLLEVSLRVVPRPRQELTLSFDLPQEEALQRLTAWSGRPLPLSAACHDGERLWLRLSGFESALQRAAAQLGGEPVAQGERFWADLREQRHDFFRPAGDEDVSLWRITLPAAAAALKLSGESLVEWGGALRWVKTPLPSPVIREIAGRGGGHATLFRGRDHHGMVFHPLSAGVYTLHRRVKAAFDPHGVLNPGRMYPDV